MLRYVTAAFVARIGPVPANILAVLVFAILGFVHPAFWIGGAVLELFFLLALATNSRFRTAVDATRRTGDAELAEKRLQLIASLPQEQQRRFAGLLLRFERLEEIFRNQQAENWIMDINRDVLRRLEWTYLELLQAEANLDSLAAGTESEDQLRARIAEAEADDTTAAILRERLDNVQRRAQSLHQIHSDLRRIEAEVDLMIENATLQTTPQPLRSDIDAPVVGEVPALRRTPSPPSSAFES